MSEKGSKIEIFCIKKIIPKILQNNLKKINGEKNSLLEMNWKFQTLNIWLDGKTKFWFIYFLARLKREFGLNFIRAVFLARMKVISGTNSIKFIKKFIWQAFEWRKTLSEARRYPAEVFDLCTNAVIYVKKALQSIWSEAEEVKSPVFTWRGVFRELSKKFFYVKFYSIVLPSLKTIKRNFGIFRIFNGQFIKILWLKTFFCFILKYSNLIFSLYFSIYF